MGAAYTFTAGDTGVTVFFRMYQNDGSLAFNVAFDDPDLIIRYIRPDDSVVTITPAELTAVDDPWESNGFIHIGRFQKAIDGVRLVLPTITAADFDSLEWGVALGGPDSGKLDQIEKQFEYTESIGVGRCFFYRIRRNKHDQSYNSPLDEQNNPTFSHSLLKSKFAA